MIIKLAFEESVERYRVQMAGISVAANGGTKPSSVASRKAWGWSPAYQDVLKLRRDFDAALKLLSEKDRKTILEKRANIEIKHKGLLHHDLGIPEGEEIPTSLLEEKMKTTTDPALRKRLNFAINARKWKHKHG